MEAIVRQRQGKLCSKIQVSPGHKNWVDAKKDPIRAVNWNQHHQSRLLLQVSVVAFNFELKLNKKLYRSLRPGDFLNVDLDMLYICRLTAVHSFEVPLKAFNGSSSPCFKQKSFAVYHLETLAY